MAGSSEGYHEALEKLTPATLDLHRALVTLQEELEAVDWYQQRIDASEDEALKRILAHNRDEEKEHAMMLLEWIRRKDPAFDALMRTYLFTTREITEIEEAETAGVEVPGAAEAAPQAAPGPEPAAQAPPAATLTLGALTEG